MSTYPEQSELDTIELHTDWLDEIREIQSLIVYNRLNDANLRLEQLSEAIEPTQDPEWLARLYNIIGLYLDRVSRHEEAQSRYFQALELVEELENPRLNATTYRNLATSFIYSARYNEAFGYFDRALKIVRELDDKEVIAAILTNMSHLHRIEGYFDQALTLNEEALALSRELGNRQGEGCVLHNIGTGYFEQGKIDQATEYFRQSTEIFTELGMIETASSVRCDLAKVLQAQGEYDSALVEMELAIKQARDCGVTRNESYALSARAFLFATISEFGQAELDVQAALAIQRQDKNTRFEAISLGIYGFISFYRGEIETSEWYLQQSIDLSLKIGDLRSYALTTNYLAQLYQSVGMRDKAYHLYHQALEKFRSERLEMSEVRVLCQLAVWHAEEGDTTEARWQFEQVIAKCRKLPIHNSLFENLTQYAAFLIKIGELDEAQRLLDEAARNEPDHRIMVTLQYRVVLLHFRVAEFLMHHNGDSLARQFQNSSQNSEFAKKYLDLVREFERRKLGAKNPISASFQVLRNLLLQLHVPAIFLPNPKQW